jgi:hypothetical protein
MSSCGTLPVSMNPGEIELAVMPQGVSILANERVRTDKDSYLGEFSGMILTLENFNWLLPEASVA